MSLAELSPAQKEEMVRVLSIAPSPTTPIPFIHPPTHPPTLSLYTQVVSLAALLLQDSKVDMSAENLEGVIKVRH